MRTIYKLLVTFCLFIFVSFLFPGSGATKALLSLKNSKSSIDAIHLQDKTRNASGYEHAYSLLKKLSYDIDNQLNTVDLYPWLTKEFTFSEVSSESCSSSILDKSFFTYICEKSWLVSQTLADDTVKFKRITMKKNGMV